MNSQMSVTNLMTMSSQVLESDSDATSRDLDEEDEEDELIEFGGNGAGW